MQRQRHKSTGGGVPLPWAVPSYGESTLSGHVDASHILTAHQELTAILHTGVLAAMVALASLPGSMDAVALRQEAFATWHQQGLHEELVADGHAPWQAGQRWSAIRRGQRLTFQDASLDAE
jgi:hypothetical protein